MKLKFAGEANEAREGENMKRMYLLAVLVAALSVSLAGVAYATSQGFYETESANMTANTEVITQSDASPNGGINNAVRYNEDSDLLYNVEPIQNPSESVKVFAKAGAGNDAPVVLKVVVDGVVSSAQNVAKGVQTFRGYCFDVPTMANNVNHIVLIRGSGMSGWGINNTLKTDRVEAFTTNNCT